MYRPPIVQYNPELHGDCHGFIKSMKRKHYRDLGLGSVSIVDMDGEQIAVIPRRWTWGWLVALCGFGYITPTRKIDDDPVRDSQRQ